MRVDTLIAMSNTVCPQCGRAIPIEDIHMGEGAALCRVCDRLYRLSEVLPENTGNPTSRVDLDRIASGKPPVGAWIRDDGVETRIGATTRSLGTASFMWVFTLFWNGIVSIFVAIVLVSILHHANVLPKNFTPFSSSKPPMGLWTAVAVSAFLTPFVLIGAGTLIFTLLCTFGSNEVRLHGRTGRTSIGIGPARFWRRFDAGAVRAVRIRTKNSSTNGEPDRVIEIDTEDRTAEIGGMLSPARRRWMAAVLRERLVVDR